jgi:uncharacterized protein
MNTKLALVCTALLATAATAQLSSPLGAPAKAAAPQKTASMPAKTPAPATATPAASAAATPTPAGIPAGQGAGVHSSLSPFAPLQERADVVPWGMLTSIKTKTDKNKILPIFDAAQMALHRKTQKVQGFMMPLEPGEKQRHFLLTSVPMSCSFCLPGGPESMVEVRTKTPIKYTLDPVVVEGTFMVLNDDPYGLYYRITEATPAK